MLSLDEIKGAFGGTIKGERVRIPAIGRPTSDRSVSISLDGEAPNGYLLHCYRTGDDPIKHRRMIDNKFGLQWPPARGDSSDSSARLNRRLAPEKPVARIALTDVPLPAMTPRKPGDRFGLQNVGQPEPPSIRGEIAGRRHAYLRDGEAVRFKIKKTIGAPWIDFYRVRDPATGKVGWQAHRPEGFVLVPYLGQIDPFHADHRDEVVFWPEGEKDVDTLDRLGLPSFTFGGASDVPEGCGELLRGRDVVVLADNDGAGRIGVRKKLEACTGVATRVRVVTFPELEEGQDVTDWVDAGGTAEALWRLIDEAAAPPLGPEAGDDSSAERVDAPAGPETLLLGFAFDGDAPTEPPRYLVKNMLPAEGVTILGGQSGAGKTFAAIALATSLATGEPFFGRRVVERVGTLILAAEGAGTIQGRITAARLDRTKENRLPIAWLGAVGNLANLDEVRALQPKIKAVDAAFRERFGVRLGVIVIDTLAAAFALSDENDAAQAQGALRHMRMLGDPIGALVLPIHHYGKSEDVGLRGSSAYRGGADAVLSVLAERNNATGAVGKRSLNLAKTRYGEEGPIAGFSLSFVELGTDDDGDPFGACIVVPELDTPAPVRVPPQKDGLGIVALKGAFDEVMMACGREVPVREDGSKVRAVTVKDLRAEFRRRYATAETEEAKVGSTVRQALKRALASCTKHGFCVASWGGEEWLWRRDR